MRNLARAQALALAMMSVEAISAAPLLAPYEAAIGIKRRGYTPIHKKNRRGKFKPSRRR